jgi:hypothetical protein
MGKDMNTTRRTALLALAATVVAGVPASAKETDMLRSILEASQTEKKGVTLYVKGQAIPGIVVKTDSDSVELRSREYSRIVIRIDAIDGAAMA